jgi:hypothetical protein
MKHLARISAPVRAQVGRPAFLDRESGILGFRERGDIVLRLGALLGLLPEGILAPGAIKGDEV